MQNVNALFMTHFTILVFLVIMFKDYVQVCKKKNLNESRRQVGRSAVLIYILTYSRLNKVCRLVLLQKKKEK